MLVPPEIPETAFRAERHVVANEMLQAWPVGQGAQHWASWTAGAAAASPGPQAPVKEGAAAAPLQPG
jgi:hypothetical protein